MPACPINPPWSRGVNRPTPCTPNGVYFYYILFLATAAGNPPPSPHSLSEKLHKRVEK